ncbi:unnamed protein product [Mytilus edulis]|uniref:Ankyrin repeat protein n=1 Tax=Mytilus edulis TaxID=6550 RepID=A0A8S3U809_MYTED|nr:unnamed protein product [Mytilus edulis]
MKNVLITSLYEICSTKDVRCVKATLNLVKEEKITVLHDQGFNLNHLGLQTSYYFNHNHKNCVFLVYCIWKAYTAFNEPVLEYLLSMYNKIPIDVNLLLKTFYSTDWLKGLLTSVSYKPLKWMMERFEVLVDTELIIRAACQCNLFDTVEYLSTKCETFDAISYLKIFLCENISNFDFDKDLFDFLFSKINITTPEMNSTVAAVLINQYVPDYVCKAFLPVCINNEAILNLVCKEAHIYITKLILENSHNVNIQSALISVCMENKTTDFLDFLSVGPDDEVEKLEIVKFIVGKYGYEQYDLKIVCQQAYQTRKFNIIEWLVLNTDLNLLDVHCIINSA